MTFQAWKMVLLNNMTFQEEWSPCTSLVMGTAGHRERSTLHR